MAFIKVKNTQKYLKAVIFGEAGTGKTTLAEKIAIGISKMENKNKVYIIDTEGGIDFFAEHLQEEGIECFQSDVKFDTYDKFANELANVFKENPPVLIIDNITSIGELLQKQYITDPRKSFQEWGKAKEMHRKKVISLIQNAPFHIIICGREAKGEGELADIKIRLGIDIDYELNLLVRTTREMEDDNQIRIAHILKDRTTKIDGKKFKNAKFEDFLPIFSGLSKHQDSELFKEIESKLLACSDTEYFDIITENIKDSKDVLNEEEMNKIKIRWSEVKNKLFSNVKIENNNI